MTTAPFSFSVVIPCFNEEERLPGTLKRLQAWSPTFASEVEIVLVDDGSADATLKILEEYAQTDSRARVVRQPHVGAMHALLGGYGAAKGAFIGNMEADCAAAPEEFGRLVPFLAEYDVVIGSRQLRGNLGPIQGKTAMRRVLSWGMSRLFTTLFSCGVRDPQIGFKVFKAEVLKQALPLLASPHDGMKTAELVVKAHALGYRVKEVPVSYVHDERSRLVPKWPHRIVWAALLALLRLWVDSYVQYRREGLARCPVRGAFVLGGFEKLGILRSAQG